MSAFGWYASYNTVQADFVIEQTCFASGTHGGKLASALEKSFLPLFANRDPCTQQTPYDVVMSVGMVLEDMSKE